MGSSFGFPDLHPVHGLCLGLRLFTLLAASAGTSRSHSAIRAKEVLPRCPGFWPLFLVGFVTIWLLLSWLTYP